MEVFRRVRSVLRLFPELGWYRIIISLSRMARRRPRLTSRKITTDMPLVHHYLMVGELMSISPQKMFDVQYYLNTNDDVVDSPLPALVHYIRFGHAEGRSPHPLFDTAHYNRSVEKGNRNRKRDKLNPLMRFIENLR